MEQFHLVSNIFQRHQNDLVILLLNDLVKAYVNVEHVNGQNDHHDHHHDHGNDHVVNDHDRGYDYVIDFLDLLFTLHDVHDALINLNEVCM